MPDRGKRWVVVQAGRVRVLYHHVVLEDGNLIKKPTLNDTPKVSLHSFIHVCYCPGTLGACLGAVSASEVRIWLSLKAIAW